MTATHPHPKVQRDFIEAVRAKIDGDESYFESHDWRMITPPNGRHCSLLKSVCADSFCVRPMAVWLPEKLLPNFTPTCPHCKSNRHVDLAKARWQNSPKILFGVNGHRYLDAKLHPCHSCKRQFTGYHPDSMEADARHFTGFSTSISLVGLLLTRSCIA